MEEAPVHTFEHEGARYELLVEAHDEPPPEGIDGEALRDLHDPDGASLPPRSLAIRSFTIRDAATGERVFDSKSGLNRLLASLAPDLLDGAADDGRGRRCVSIGRVNGRLFAYIRLETLGGIAVLDLTNPRNPEFVDYHDQRRNGGAAGA
jgi:hypothetical protein